MFGRAWDGDDDMAWADVDGRPGCTPPPRTSPRRVIAASRTWVGPASPTPAVTGRRGGARPATSSASTTDLHAEVDDDFDRGRAAAHQLLDLVDPHRHHLRLRHPRPRRAARPFRARPARRPRGGGHGVRQLARRSTHHTRAHQPAPAARAGRPRPGRCRRGPAPGSPEPPTRPCSDRSCRPGVEPARADCAPHHPRGDTMRPFPPRDSAQCPPSLAPATSLALAACERVRSPTTAALRRGRRRDHRADRLLRRRRDRGRQGGGGCVVRGVRHRGQRAKAATDLPQELSQGFTSNNPPDVFYVSTDTLAGFAANGSLWAYGDDLANADDFYPTLVDAFTVDGDFYCAPKDFSTLGLVINHPPLEGGRSHRRRHPDDVGRPRQRAKDPDQGRHRRTRLRPGVPARRRLLPAGRWRDRLRRRHRGDRRDPREPSRPWSSCRG